MRLDSSMNFFASRFPSSIHAYECNIGVNTGTGALSSWALFLAEKVGQDDS